MQGDGFDGFFVIIFIMTEAVKRYVKNTPKGKALRNRRLFLMQKNRNGGKEGWKRKQG